MLEDFILFFLNFSINFRNIRILIFSDSSFTLLNKDFNFADLGLNFFNSCQNYLELTVKVDITDVSELLKSHIHFFKTFFVFNEIVLLIFAHLDRVNIVNECLKSLWGPNKSILNLIKPTEYLFGFLAGKVIQVGSYVDLLLLYFGN